jgi:hypothetical protein
VPARVTAEAYRADDLLRRTDGRIDVDYEAQLTDAARQAQEAELLVAVEDSHVLGSVTWCRPHHHGASWPPTPTKRNFECSRLRQLGAVAVSAGPLSRRASCAAVGFPL